MRSQCQEVFMAAILAFHSGKAVVPVPAIEIAIDHLLDIPNIGSVAPTWVTTAMKLAK